MMISTKGRYALRIMIDLAQNRELPCVSLRDISKRQKISVKYMEALVSALHKASLVESKMGKNGGYRLAKDPSCYSIGEILKTAEGELVPVGCLQCREEKPVCERAADCITLPMWKELDRLISGYLDHITLEDLVEGRIGAGQP